MKHRLLTAGLTGLGMLVLILDAKTALFGAAEGVSLCVKTVIPSLFPFLFLSILLTGALNGLSFPALRPLCRLLKIQPEAASIYLVGLLGGYPAGAQSISIACKRGQLSPADARRMMAFCNNAGPAFLFGIGVVIFDAVWPCFLLWGIQILSSVMVAMAIPKEEQGHFSSAQLSPVSLSQAMKQSLESMALICGWVILFRVLLTFLQRWFLWLLPAWGQILIAGLMELTNGCCALTELPTQGARLLFFALFSGFGGLCVCLQTLSITAGTKGLMELYLPGKLLQGCLCLLLATAAQFLFPPHQRLFQLVPVLLSGAMVGIFYILARKKQKKGVAFQRKLVYNQEKSYI